MEVLPQLEKRTHYLATFANLATLLGLLGTVSGLIHAFSAVATANPAEKANLLSASISEAMNCTAFGLMVAVPLLFVHAFLQTKTTRADRQPRDGRDQVPECLDRARHCKSAGRRASSRRARHKDRPCSSNRSSPGSASGRKKPAELLLVPMIDIFTVLVTFLLMTAVFSRITIIQLDLPSAAAASPSEPDFRLEVIVRKEGFELTNGRDAHRGHPDGERRVRPEGAHRDGSRPEARASADARPPPC